MGEDAVVGEDMGEETTTQRRGFWAKSSKNRLLKKHISEAIFWIFVILDINSDCFGDHFRGQKGSFLDVFPRFHF